MDFFVLKELRFHAPKGQSVIDPSSAPALHESAPSPSYRKSIPVLRWTIPSIALEYCYAKVRIGKSPANIGRQKIKRNSEMVNIQRTTGEQKSRRNENVVEKVQCH